MRRFFAVLTVFAAFLLSPLVSAQVDVDVQQLIDRLQQAQAANDVGTVNTLAGNMEQAAARLQEAAAAAEGTAAESMAVAAENLQAAASAAYAGNVTEAVAIPQTSQPAIVAGIGAAQAAGISTSLLAGVVTTPALVGAAVAAGLAVAGTQDDDDAATAHHAVPTHQLQ